MAISLPSGTVIFGRCQPYILCVNSRSWLSSLYLSNSSTPSKSENPVVEQPIKSTHFSKANSLRNTPGAMFLRAISAVDVHDMGMVPEPHRVYQVAFATPAGHQYRPHHLPAAGTSFSSGLYCFLAITAAVQRDSPLESRETAYIWFRQCMCSAARPVC